MIIITTIVTINVILILNIIIFRLMSYLSERRAHRGLTVDVVLRALLSLHPVQPLLFLGPPVD